MNEEAVAFTSTSELGFIPALQQRLPFRPFTVLGSGTRFEIDHPRAGNRSVGFQVNAWVSPNLSVQSGGEILTET